MQYFVYRFNNKLHYVVVDSNGNIPLPKKHFSALQYGITITANSPTEAFEKAKEWNL